MTRQSNTQHIRALISSYKPGLKYIRFNKNILPSSYVNNSQDLPVLMDNFESRIKNSISCQSVSAGVQTKYSDGFIHKKVTKDFNIKSVFDTIDNSSELSQEEKNKILIECTHATIEMIKMHRDACLNQDIQKMEEALSIFYSSLNKNNIYFRGECFTMLNEISQYYSFNINISPKELAINLTTRFDPSFNPKEIKNLYFHDSALSSGTNLLRNTNEFLDAIVLARKNPNLVIHLTCDQKWSDVEKELGLSKLALRGSKPQTNPDLVIIDLTDNSYSIRDLKITNPGKNNLEYNVNNTYNLGSVSDSRKFYYKNIFVQNRIEDSFNVLDNPNSSSEEKQYARQQIKFFNAQLKEDNNTFDVSIHPKFRHVDGFSIITSNDYNPPCGINDIIKNE